ncbi:MAG: hypothetical protein ACRDRM_02205, partial [Pseudonocardiaceae bacterium]
VLAGLLWGATHTVAMKAAREALGEPARPAARLLWRGIGPATGATLAGAFAVLSTPRGGLAIGVVLLAVAALAVAPGTLADRAGHGEVTRDRGGPRVTLP